MKRISLFLSLITTLVLLFACGGGGGDGLSATTPTDPSTVFDLAEFNSLDVGDSYAFFLTGSDSNGHRWEGSISVIIEPIVDIGGVDNIPEEVLLSPKFLEFAAK